jgi:hypothetical protein
VAASISNSLAATLPLFNGHAPYLGFFDLIASFFLYFPLICIKKTYFFVNFDELLLASVTQNVFKD